MLVFTYRHGAGPQTVDDTWIPVRLLNRHAPDGSVLETQFHFPPELVKKWGERDFRYLDRWIGDLYDSLVDVIEENGWRTPDPRTVGS